MTCEHDESVGADKDRDGEDAELGRVLEAYLAGLEAGRPDDCERLLSAHPAIAQQLRACLRVLNLADRMIEASDSASGVSRPALRLESTMARQGESSRTTVGSGPPPHVQLRDLPDESDPVIKPRSTEVPAQNGSSLGRYQLQGEIARGGMGAILKGRDVDLGRDLALKVLLESHQGNPEVVSRFIEEAQIGGQLQHPGIAPVYELGTFPEPDRRPYFAMKLVKGQTLAALLQERPDPAHDRPRFLGIFEQICQTVAYAHARGVIHRDLKPSNVMVGSFGEVQLMDWGLAKVLPKGGIADEAAAQPAPESFIMTVRSGSSASGGDSQAGSVLGTPAYMAPEQARGEMDRIDERADVFGLGAILCEILTGRPPFAGSTREEIRARAARGDLTDALRRLGASGADDELINLARSCLAADREGRPRNAGEVARRMTSYLTGVQERLRAAELARVEAQARAAEERKRRRLAVALAASVLSLVVLGAGGWTYLARQKMERAAGVALALREVELLRDEARRAGDDLTRWIEARDAAKAVERLLADVHDEPTQSRMTALVRDVTQAAAAAENDQNLMAKLVDIRSAKADDLDGSVSDAEYTEAFREAGIDIATLPPAEVGAKIRTRPAAVRVALAAALDDWAAVRRGRQGGRAGALRLTEAARHGDPDPWRNRLREALQSSTSQQRLTKLKDLARSAPIHELPAVSLYLLGATLLDMGDPTGAEAVLRAGQRLHPGDVWLNYDLARCLERLTRREEAIRYYMVARSLRPETAHDLAHALEAKGETAEAIVVLQDLVRLRSTEGAHLGCLGAALGSLGRTQEARTVLEAATAAFRAAIRLKPDLSQTHAGLGDALRQEGKLGDAIAEYRDALRLKPDFASAHDNLGMVLRDQGKLDEAIAEHREALRLKPDLAHAHNNLGITLRKQGKRDEAIAEYRESLRLKPDFPEAHSNLGNAMGDQAKMDEAIAEHREALRLKPDRAESHNNLGAALKAQGKAAEAIAEYREALRLKPDYLYAHYNLGQALAAQGKLDEAITEFREALRLEPEFAEAHNNLGVALHQLGKPEEAIAEAREALRLNPNCPEAHNNLGNALKDQGKLNDAIDEYRIAHRLKPDYAEAHNNLGNALRAQGKLDEAIGAYREALRLEPDFAEAHNSLGNAFRDQRKLDEAIAEFRAALRLKPDLAHAHNNLGTALNDQGKRDEAIAEYRKAMRLNPNYPEAHFNVGNVLREQGKLDESIAEYSTALRLKSDFAEAHCNLGDALRRQGRFAEALDEYKRGHELGSKNPSWRYPSAEWVRQAERLIALDCKLPAIFAAKAKPSDATESLELAQLCYDKKLHGTSARLSSEAFQAQPKLADDMQAQHRYNAACAAALAGTGQGKDDPPLDEAAKNRWRKQAITWLKADLKAWSKLRESASPQVRRSIKQTLQHWKSDLDLTALRDPAALAKLPDDEQKACQALWAEVDTILARTNQESSP
jgi:serine/threonine-protein kinase